MFSARFVRAIVWPSTPPEVARLRIEGEQRAKAAELHAEVVRVCLRHRDGGLDRKLMVKVAAATAKELEKLAK